MTDPSLRIPSVGIQPARPPQFPNREERAAERQRRQTEALARRTAFSIMQQGKQRPESSIGQDSLVETPITPEEKGVWGKTFDAIDSVFKPFGSMYLAFAGESPVDFIPDEWWRPAILNILEESPSDPNAALDWKTNPAEQDRIRRSKDIIKAWSSGEMSFSNAWSSLENIQHERPLGLQIASELVADPTNLIPFGMVKTGLRAPITAARAARVGRLREAILPTSSPTGRGAATDEVPWEMGQLPTPSELKKVAQSPETMDYTSKLFTIPFLKMALKNFGENGMANLKNKAVQLVTNVGFYQSATKTAADVDTAWILRKRSAKRTFQPNFENGDVSLDPIHVQRRSDISLRPTSAVFGVARPGGARIPLSGERLRSMIPDLFAGRVSLQDVSGRTALSQKAIIREQDKARLEALRSIFDIKNGVINKDWRTKVLERWGVEDVITSSRQNLKISDQTLKKFLENPEIVRHLDEELAGSMRGRATGTRYTGVPQVIGTPDAPRNLRRGQWYSGFLRNASREKIFDDAVRALVLSNEVELGPAMRIAEGTGDVYRRLDSPEPWYTRQREKIYFDEVMQNPELFVLSPELQELVDDYLMVISKYVKEGIRLKAIPDTDFIGKVPGNWVSAIWRAKQSVDYELSFTDVLNYTDDVKEVVRGVPREIGKKQPTMFGARKIMEDSRIRDYLADSLDRGFRGADIDSQIQRTLLSFQQMMAEKLVMDAAAAWTPALRKRIKEGGRVFFKDLKNLKNFPPESLRQIEKMLSDQTSSWIDAMYDVSSAARAMQTGLDVGAPFIHGLPLAFSDPVAWSRATSIGMEAMTDPIVANSYLANKLPTVRKMQKYNGISLGDSEYMEGLRRETSLIGRGLTKLQESNLPGGRRVSKVLSAATEGASRNFNTYLFAARVEAWESMEGAALAHAKQRAAKKFRKAKKVEQVRNMLETNPVASEQMWRQLLQGEEDQALRMLSEHINKMLGTLDSANTGLRPSRRKLIGSVLMYAPRYRLAGYALMADALRGGYRGHMAREKLGNLLTSGMMWYSYVATRLNQEPQLNPLDSKFLTIKVGNDSYIGIGSMHVTMMRFMASLIAKGVGGPVSVADRMTDADLDQQLRDMPDSGVLEAILDNHQDKTLLTIDSDGMMQRFVRSQIAPLTGASWSIIEGRNYIGDPIDDTLLGIPLDDSNKLAGIANVGASSIFPFWLSGFFSHASSRAGEALNKLTDDAPFTAQLGTWTGEFGASLGGGAIAGMSEFAGLRSYPVSSRARAMTIAEEEIQAAIELGELNVSGEARNVQWTDLTGQQKAFIISKNEIIQELLDESRRRWSDISTGSDAELAEAASARATAGLIHGERLDEINEFMVTGQDAEGNPFSGEDFRREISRAGRAFANEMQRINNNLSKQAQQEYAEFTADRIREGNIEFFDEAYYDYIERILSPEWETSGGDFMFNEYQDAEEQFFLEYTGNIYGTVGGEEHGELHEVVQYIQQMQSKDFPDVVQEYKINQKALRPYWEVPEQIIRNIGLGTNELNIYNQYRNADGVTQRLMRELYPWIATVDNASRQARIMLRERHINLDHFLLRYSYVGTGRHPSLMNLSTDMLQVVARTPLAGDLWD